MRWFRLLAAVILHALAVLALASPARAAPTHIAAALVAEGPGTPGGTVMLAFHMKPQPGWHGYWSNPGDAGLGMSVDWRLPAGGRAGELRYPVPQTLLISGLMNHVYKGDYALLVPLTLPGDARAGDVLTIAADAQWLACTDEICVPERATVQTRLAIAAPGEARTVDRRFDGWMRKLPAPLGETASFARSGQTLRIAIPLPANVALDSPHFFASEDRVADYAAAQAFRRKGDVLIVELARPKIAAAEPAKVSGVLRLNAAGDGLEIASVPGAVPTGGEPVAAGSEHSATAFALLLAAALAGGLLLNVMPCVFPILSLKAMSLARAGESETQARREGLAYTAGVVLACTALGALLLVLRAGGEEVGWAFQLQEPGVVAVLLLLAIGITANFLGLFEFAVPGFASAGSPRSAFATGLLAAFVATPCTGPFMAGAMGAALLLPVVPAIALFAALGLGIALPFLALAFVPGLRRRMPRPGPWMARFRRWMAVPMGLTALALLWLAERLGGPAFALGAAAAAVALVVVLALAGRGQRAGKAVGRLVWPATIVLAVLAVVALPRLATVGNGRSEAGVLDAQPFSAEALERARASGRPVFAWFTADWCITCKVNERVAIEREDVRAAFARAGVIVLKGDWTRRDPAITRYLTAQGAAGVPLYVWYPASGGAGEKLPQVLGPSALVELAER